LCFISILTGNPDWKHCVYWYYCTYCRLSYNVLEPQTMWSHATAKSRITILLL